MTYRYPPGTETATRLLGKVVCDVGTRCWIWQAARSEAGYGRIAMPYGWSYAHRVSYETFVGPIPEGLQIDHLCRVPACVRPEHLEAVTPQVNVRRGESPGAKAIRRTHCAAGHPFSEHGVIRAGRRVCRICRIEYMHNWRRRAAA